MNTQNSNTISTDANTERPIGNIIREANNLSAEQVEQVLAHQKQSGLKFGEAAVALGLIQRDQVLWALSQQFHYPYTKAEVLPASTELVCATNPFGEFSESLRDLRSQLISGIFSAPDSRHCIAVVSPNIGEGKTFFAANLAIAFSQLGARTLLVDADMRSPRAHTLFDIQSERGLSSILAGRIEANVIRPIEELPSLYVLPVGVTPPNPLELVQRPAFGAFLHDVSTKFDYVIVDTPAAAHGADARIIAAACGAAVLVGRQNTTRLADIKELSSQLKAMKTTIAGVIMNEH